MASRDENAVSYALAILYDAEVEPSVENIKAILAAANVEVEPYWPMLMANMAQSRNIGEIITGDDGVAEEGEATKDEAEAAPAAGGDSY